MTIQSDTRVALFEAGLRVIERDGAAQATLARIAKSAGVSRQAVYLHFGSRAGFLLGLMDYLNEREGFTLLPDQVRTAASADAALRRLILVRATSAARNATYIIAFNAAVSDDAVVAELWAQRQAFRLRVFEGLAQRMKADGVLREDLPAGDAAALMWVTLSFESWNYLVRTRGWSTRKYVRRMHDLITRAIMR